MAEMTPARAVSAACDAHHVVGTELRELLTKEVPAKVLLRRARDVVLLSGATGAGKEKVAATCHDAAGRYLERSGDLVEVNCANLTGGLFESELFGYRKGAFTGADRDRAGLAAQASGGTLVLDEIQSLDPQDQARLLRFLGEREYRPVGSGDVHRCDALIVLVTNQDLSDMVRRGQFRRDVLDRASAKLHVPSLFERRRDIGELAQGFALEAAHDLNVGEDDFFGLTRRARSDVEAAVVRTREVSVRRLREIVRDAVFVAASDALPEALESDAILPILERELSYSLEARDEQDAFEIEHEFTSAVARAQMRDIAERHNVSPRVVDQLVRAVSAVIDEMDDRDRTYRNVVERTNRLSKVALWLASGAQSQAEFRRFFGQLDGERPTKSVAHQIFYEVFPKGGVQ